MSSRDSFYALFFNKTSSRWERTYHNTLPGAKYKFSEQCVCSAPGPRPSILSEKCLSPENVHLSLHCTGEEKRMREGTGMRCR